MTRAERLVQGACLGLALFALASHIVLIVGGAVGAAWLPIALLAGVAVRRSWLTAATQERERGARWLRVTVFGVLAAVVLVLGYGAIATPPRHWDGVTAWGVRAQELRDAPQLDQPAFTDPGVFAHSREYPLLQPLLQATLDRWVPGAGGALFPALFVLLLAVAWNAWRRAGVAHDVRCVLLLALGLVPMFVAPTSGAIDSGFAELFAGTCLMMLAAGLFGGDRVLLACGAFLLPLVKPEGVAYPLVAAAACWVAARRAELAVVVAAWWGGMMLWAPIYLRLTLSEVSFTRVAAVVAAIAAAILGTQILIARAGSRRALTAVAVPATAIVVFGALVQFQPAFASVPGVIGVYLGGGDHAVERLVRLPEIVGGLVAEMLRVRKFGLTFVVLAALALLPRRLVGRAPSGALAAFVGLGLLCTIAPFLLSPEPDLAHHLHSSADRLLLHWVAPVWLLAGAWWAKAVARVATVGSAE